MQQSRILEFRRRPDDDPTPPAAPCSECGGAGYFNTWLPDFRTGYTVCTGATACTSCNGSGRDRQVSIKATVERATAEFHELWNMLDTETANALLAEAAAIDRGDYEGTTRPGWWRDEAARAATNLRFVERALERKYRVAAMAGEEPDPEELRPYTEGRGDWLEWQHHCEYTVHVLEDSERLAAA